MGDILKNFGISTPTILYTLGNLVLLVVGLYFLLVKPVKKIMAERKAKSDAVFAENKRLNEEASEARLKYAKKMEEASEQIAVMMNESAKAAEDKAAEIVESAKKKAREILTGAKEDAEAERERVTAQIEEEIASLAVDIAGKVLEREVKEKDNAKIVEECLGKWAS